MLVGMIVGGGSEVGVAIAFMINAGLKESFSMVVADMVALILASTVADTLGVAVGSIAANVALIAAVTVDFMS